MRSTAMPSYLRLLLCCLLALPYSVALCHSSSRRQQRLPFLFSRAQKSFSPYRNRFLLFQSLDDLGAESSAFDDDEQGVPEENSSNNATDITSDNSDGEEIMTTTVRMDDGGSNLTDRFKYKVNALMGVFDPADVEANNERGSGNILNALLDFPVNYSFNVVGKTRGDKTLEEEFIQQVKAIVLKGSGDDEENVLCQIIPRGKSFTKVTVEVQVDSAIIISSIYEQLEELEISVMQF
jgi:putative lipoic acid-binding regulatory protein